MSQAQWTTQPARAGSSPKRMDLPAPLGEHGGPRGAAQKLVRAAKVQMYEAALLLSVAAAAPMRLIRALDEPANSMLPNKTAPTPGTSPVLLVHGLGGDKSSWTLVAQALSERGLTVEVMTYAPVGNSVEQLADRLVATVKHTLSRTGASKVHLVGHSLGGVIIAQAISDRRLLGRVATVITLGSPFGGSPWAGVLPVVDIVRALRPASPLLRRIASTPPPDGVRWLSVTAAHDIIVPGVRSVPPHPQAETITISGVGHLGMLMSQRVISFIAAACTETTAVAAAPALHVLPSAS